MTTNLFMKVSTVHKKVTISLVFYKQSIVVSFRTDCDQCDVIFSKVTNSFAANLSFLKKKKTLIHPTFRYFNERVL